MKFDIIEIMKRLPHRYPFLLVDRVLELVEGESIVAIKNVTMNEQFFQGHFPGNPIMPGVLTIEAMAQAGGILAIETFGADDDYKVYFMSIDKAKFRKPVVPGDQLRFEATVTRKRGKVWKISAKALVDGKVASEADFTAMITKEEI